MPLEVDSKVRVRGTEQPIGIVEELFGIITATVRWGVADGHTFREDLNQDDLEVVPEYERKVTQ